MSGDTTERPVTLPPGRARLVTAAGAVGTRVTSCLQARVDSKSFISWSRGAVARALNFNFFALERLQARAGDAVGIGKNKRTEVRYLLERLQARDAGGIAKHKQ